MDEKARARTSRKMKAHAALVRDVAESCRTSYEIVNRRSKDLREAGLLKLGLEADYRETAKARAILLRDDSALKLASELEYGGHIFPKGSIVPDHWLPAGRRITEDRRTIDRGVYEPSPAPPKPVESPPVPAAPTDAILAARVKIMLWAIRKIGSTDAARDAFERAVVAITPGAVAKPVGC